MKNLGFFLLSTLSACVVGSDDGESTQLESSLNGPFSQYELTEKYFLPTSKQGVNDQARNARASSQDRMTRTLIQRDMDVSVHQYNTYWKSFEDSGIRSSVTPIACPTGYRLFPENENEKIRVGAHKYRCLNNRVIEQKNEMFSLDTRLGYQVSVVIYAAPEMYTHGRCEGFEFAGNHLYLGCVPRFDAMDDFEDFSTFLASHYNNEENGNINHVIVWNEAASTDWFDFTPYVDKSDQDGRLAGTSIARYAKMFRLVHNAFARHADDVMLYVSTDKIWEDTGVPNHFSSKRLLEGMWTHIGIELPWSVAVHPYGSLNSRDSNRYNFANLSLVTDFQKNKLREHGVTNPSSYPQAYVAATEQSIGLRDNTREERAKWICEAHAAAVELPEMVYVAHNYFQSFEAEENQVGGNSNQGDFLGLIPEAVGDDLDGMLETPEGRAYKATSSSESWNVQSSHDCCRLAGVGCAQSVGLNHPWVFDADYYRAHNADLAGLSDVELDRHWRVNGVDEGRSASPLFSSQEYRLLYPDLQNAFGQNFKALTEHFVASGISEGRVGRTLLVPRSFDANAYRQRYSDLKHLTTVQLKKHWVLHGFSEGRNASL